MQIPKLPETYPAHRFHTSTLYFSPGVKNSATSPLSVLNVKTMVLRNGEGNRSGKENAASSRTYGGEAAVPLQQQHRKTNWRTCPPLALRAGPARSLGGCIQ